MAKIARISDILKEKKTSLSFEVYPPKTDDGVIKLLHHLKVLEQYHPDFISVTYGAGGSNQDRSLEVLEKVHTGFNGAVLAHFTCVGLDKENIRHFIGHLTKLNIINILALRGDPPKDAPGFDFSKNYFKYSSELVSFLKKETGLCIGVAGYPEGHIEAPDKESDWDNLKKKVDTGAEFVITQLFFNNTDYYEFREGMNKRKINVPLIPGILPVPSIERLQKSINLSGTKVSDEFRALADRYLNDPVSFKKASVEYFIKQIKELLVNGAPGIHYYVLNSSDPVSRVIEGVNQNGA